MSETVWIILAGAVATYFARAGGHLVLSRFERIHPRVEAGLDAVPAAVLTTLFAPALFNGGLAEIGAMVAAGALALRFSLMPMFIAGAVVLIGLRYLLG
ncbi:MAG: AzlD family protein [Mesorhizobium sp.]|nr:AzlD family protein [Mesorhizobium sp.]MCO5163178.1 AzlD family protein [Mesorhizobium sp.]